jgi:hypothetical protein
MAIASFATRESPKVRDVSSDCTRWFPSRFQPTSAGRRRIPGREHRDRALFTMEV